MDKRNITKTGVFQSLFYWILFLRKWQIFGVQKKALVSILVLLDFVLKVLRLVGEGGKIDVFQSLFYWILFLRKVASSQNTNYKSVFQSLFYWILFLRKDERRCWTFIRLVSILVLLDFVLKASMPKNSGGFCVSFNPCFIGFCS